MRRILLLFILCVLTLISRAQLVTGDFRSVASGNWSTNTTWQIRTGSNTWSSAGSGVFPGANDNVYLQSGFTVTLTGNASCKDLNISNNSTGTRLAIGTNTLSVNGKLRSFNQSSATTSGSDGNVPGTDATQSSTSAWITSSTGKISIVGTTRTLTSSSQWGASNAGTSSPNGFDLEINLTNSTDVVTINTAIKARNYTITNGVLTAIASATISTDQGSAAAGNLTISSNGTIITAATGTGTPAFQRSGNATTGYSGTLTVNGLLKFTGAAPVACFNAYDFSGGTVEYGASGIQTFVANGNGGTASPNSYKNLTLSGTSAKTASTASTVSGTLSLQGTASLASSPAVTYSGGSSILEYAGSSSQTSTDAEFPSSSGPVALKINNSSGVNLHATRTLTGALTLTTGIISLGNFTLTAGSASGGSTSSYVATNGTGSLKMNVPATNTNITFPIGTTSRYNPIILNNNGGTADNYSIKVASGAPSNTANASTNYVQNTWTITEAVAGGSNLAITTQWNASSANTQDEGSTFSRSGVKIGYYSGSGTTWITNNATVGVSNPYTAAASTFTPSDLTAGVAFVTGNFLSLATEPTSQGSISFGTVSKNSVVVNFTSGDGAKRIVVARSGGDPSTNGGNPIDGITYTANAAFSSGTQIGTGNYVVYAGTGNTVTVTGLSANTTYYFAVYEYNDNNTSAAENYLTTSPGTNNKLTLTTESVATAASSVLDVSFSANWGSVTGATSYRLDVSTDINFGSFVSAFNDLNVSNVTTYSVTGLTLGTTYYYRVRAVNGSGSSANSNTITTTTLSLASEPTSQGSITFGTVTKNSIVVNFSSGDGAKRVVVARSGSDPSANGGNPFDGTTYTDNVIFGSGTQIGTGNYVVYAGVGNTVTVTGLSANTIYYFAVYEYNDNSTSTQENYLTTLPGTANQLSLTTESVATAATNKTGISFSANWGAVTGATSYSLDVSTDINFGSFVSGFNDLNVANVTTYGVTGLSASTTYYYRVRAVNASGSSANSNTITTITLAAEPTSQGAITFGTITKNTVVLNFTSGDGAKRILIARSGSDPSTNGGNPVDGTTYTANAAFTSGTQIGTGNYVVYANTGNTVTVTGLSANTTYYFAVYEYNDNNTAGQENYLVTSPGTANQLTLTTETVATSATNTTNTSFSANWGSVTGATSYRLDVSTDNSFGSFEPGYNNLNVANVTTYSVTGLSAATTYYYRIRAANGAGSSASSNTITAPTLSSSPAVQPGNLSFTSVGVTSMTINFNAGDGSNRIVLLKSGSVVNSDPVDATSYTANTIFGSGSLLGIGNYVVYNGSGTSVTVTGLSPLTTYHVAVYEFNGSGGGENYLTTSPLTGNQSTAVANYRTATGVTTATWSGTSTWEYFNGTTWVATTGSPTSADGTITIRTGSTITVSTSVTADQVTIDAGGQVNVSASQTFTINDGTGTDLTVNGYLKNQGTVTLSGSASMTVGDGSTNNGTDGTYEHAVSGGSIPTATWNTYSICYVTGATGTSGPSAASTSQNFYHFTWNCTGQTGNISLGFNNNTIGGNFILTSVGTPTTSALRFTTAATSATNNITINGNIVISSGLLTTHGSGSGTSAITVTVGGNITVASGAKFDLNNGSTATTTSVWNLSGNLSISGTLQATTNASTSPLHFARGTGTQSFTNSSGTLTSGALIVDANSTLNLGSNLINGSVTFTLSAGATLETTLTTGVNGNLTTSGTKTLTAGANYIFDGSSAQVIGALVTNSINNLTINNSAGVTLSANSTVTGVLALSSGKLTLSTFTLTLGSSASISGASSSKYIVTNGTGLLKRSSVGNTATSYPIGNSTSSYTPLTISNTGTVNDISISSSSTITNSVYDATKIVTLQWTVNSSGTGAVANITYNWNVANQAASFSASGSAQLGVYTSSGPYALTSLGTFSGQSISATGISLASGNNFMVLANANNIYVPEIAGWNMSTQSGGANFFGSSPLTATTTGSNITLGGLTKGSGVVTTGATGAARGWGGIGWDNNGVASTASDNITANKFITFTITPNSGFYASLLSLNPIDYRRSGTGPSSALLQYKINSGNYIDITTLSFPTSTSAGDHAGPVDLSSILALQNLQSISTVTFRIVPYGATGSAGTFYIWDFSASTASDLAMSGVISSCSSTSAAPVISSPICNGATSVSGTSSEADGTLIDVYIGGNYTIPATTATVSSGAWSATITALTAGNIVTAYATASGKCVSAVSSSVTVQSVSTAPTITSTTLCPAGTTVSGSSSEADGTAISVYKAGNTLIGTTTVSGGVWNATVSSLSASDVITATATGSGKCVSLVSTNVTVQGNSSAPVVTQPICAGATSISGTSTEADGTTITVYINGGSAGTTTVSSGTWSKTVTAVSANDAITAIALASGKCISASSGTVTVQSNSTAPVVNATCAGSTSISGTSTEADGTTITVYVNAISGGTTTVSSGIWTKSVSAVSASDALTATAQATGKCVSSASSSVIVDATSVGGSISGSATVCSNSNGSTLTLSGNTGSILKWQSSTDNFSSSADIVNTTATQNFSNLTQTTYYRAVVQSGACSLINSSTATITVNTAVNITVQPSTTTVCSGATSFTVTATGTSITYQWQLSTDGGNNFNNLSNTGVYTTVTTNTLNISNTAGLNNYQYRVVISGAAPCASVTSNAATLMVGNTWTGSIDDNWNTSGNWACGNVPSASDNVIIPNVTIKPVLNGSVVVGDVNINSSSTLDIGASNTLSVSGSVSGSGTITGSPTSNLIIGSNAGTLNFTQTNSSTSSLNNLTVNNSSNATLGTTLNVYGTVTANGTLDMNSRTVVLKSNASGTARVAQITGSVTNATNVTVERFTPAKSSRKWTYVASPVSGITIRNGWQDDVFITGTGTGGTICATDNTRYNSNGFDATTASAPSMYTYNATSVNGSRWVSVANTTSTNLVAGTGYRMILRGQRSDGVCADQLMSQNPAAPIDLVLSATGTLTQGNVNVPIYGKTAYGGTGNAYTLIGNPYASELSLQSFYTANSTKITNSFYFYSPNNNSNTFSTYLASTNQALNFPSGYTNGTGVSDVIVASGQSFFVERSDNASDNVTFTEAQKSVTTTPGNTFYRTQATLTDVLRVKFININDAESKEEIFINYFSGAGSSNTNITVFDSYSFNSGNTHYIASLKSTKLMSIQTKAAFNGNDTVLLAIKGAIGNHKLVFADYQNFTSANTIFLLDTYANTVTDIRTVPEYNFSISSNAASQGNNRFKIVFRSSTPLPVSYINLTAESRATNVQLNWTVGSEQNMSSYVVERSADGINYSNIGSTKATGNNYSQVSYAFADNQPLENISFYRIKALDNNGSTKYSVVVRLVRGKAGIVHVYPNPVKDQVNIITPATGKYDVRIINMYGKVIYQQTGISAQTGMITINAPQLSSGSYVLQLIDSKGNITKENFIKL